MQPAIELRRNNSETRIRHVSQLLQRRGRGPRLRRHRLRVEQLPALEDRLPIRRRRGRQVEKGGRARYGAEMQHEKKDAEIHVGVGMLVWFWGRRGKGCGG